MPSTGFLQKLYRYTIGRFSSGKLPWEVVRTKILQVHGKVVSGYPSFVETYRNPILDSPDGIPVSDGEIKICVRHFFCPADNFARSSPLYDIIFQQLKQYIHGQKECYLPMALESCREIYNRTYPTTPITKVDIQRQTNCVTVDFYQANVSPALRYSFCVRADISKLKNGTSVRESNCEVLIRYELEATTLQLKFYGYPYYARILGKQWLYESDGNACVGGFPII